MQLQGLFDRQVAVQCLILKDYAYTAVDGLGFSSQIVAGYGDLALLHRQEGGQDVDHSALACPVGAQKREDLPLPHEEADPIHSLEAVVAVLQVLDLDDSLAHLQGRNLCLLGFKDAPAKRLNLVGGNVRKR